jgi:ribulose-5-phosphate 4-epimerase/fuculose-1-phosphate aldolase
MGTDSPATTNRFSTSATAVADLRVDLAAAFRLSAEFGWHESVGNHFSASVSADGRRFLLNPRWRHFATIRASHLQLLDADDAGTMRRADAPDPSAWCIHGAVHRKVPQARVLLHCHPPYATALAALADPTLKPVDQNTARFHGMVGIDLAYGGLADDAAEGDRIAATLTRFPILLMGNHGVSVTAATVAEAFEHLYFFERASRTLMLAYASGQPLNVMPDAVAARTAADWHAYDDAAFAHFAQLKNMLDARDASYRE